VIGTKRTWSCSRKKVEVSRATRDADLTRLVQAYADRLAARARAAPYNWLNFFDFWAP
jgi:predicted LPLAT superfamily acyltransferase